MKYIFILFFMLPTIFCLVCCQEEEKNVCRPQSHWGLFNDSIAYEYGPDNKISSILYHSGNGRLKEKIVFEYDSKGRLHNVVSMDVSLDGSYKIVGNRQLEYNSKGQPDTLWYYGRDLTGKPYSFCAFAHDESGRLAKREIGPYLNQYYANGAFHRYEFNNRGDLTKVYYKTIVTIEILAQENISFDNRPRFFAGSNELEIFYIYVESYLPGRSNVITSKVLSPYPGGLLPDTIDVSYQLMYDQTGMVTSIENNFSPILLGGTLRKITYRCQ